MASQDTSASGSGVNNFPVLPPPPSNSAAAPGGQAGAGNKRLQQTQAQVDEVVGIMRVNVEKVLERDQKLSELDQRADALQHGASQFEQQAGKLKRKHWWANIKMMIIMGVIGVVLLIIIIVLLIPN
ncbi:synaptobrevin isoform X4 [Phlebotomus argentipes]|uniref:synaptobrevin isoform X4 n=1 Tax=Phlebotomus argentipes TaxID=94469 RepID=UPI0028933376|nr:synaptobrevin isoform X4 [Phlebotomus argentipes]